MTGADGRRAILLSPRHWASAIHLSAHHLAKALVGAGWQVAFVSTPTSVLHRFWQTGGTEANERFGDWWQGGGWDLDGKLFHYTPLALVPPSHQPLLRAEVVFRHWPSWTLPRLDGVLAAHGFEKPDLMVLDSAVGEAVWEQAGRPRMILRVTDRNSEFPGAPTHLIATDGHRICGGQYLERLAQISRAVYSQIASLVELERLLRAEPPGRLVLTEASDWLTANPLTWAALRKRNPGLEVHLLMPVTHRLSDLRMLFARYRGLAPNRIIAARADESPQWGAVCSLAAEEQLPISYISHGEAIPDELEPASIEQLCEAPFRAEAPSPQNRPSRSRADRDDRKFALNSWGGAA